MVLLAFLFFSNKGKQTDDVWFAEEVEKIGRTNKIEIDAAEDSPVGFGYKCMWLAIKTDQQTRVANLIGVQDPRICNWKSGIGNAYRQSIFITPVIDGWTLAAGHGLPHGDTIETIEVLKNLLNKLSAEFGEAQFFCTHRVLEYHCWMKSTNGKIDRVYSYLGERAQNVVISGEPTDIENSYQLIDTFSEDAQHDDYWEREDLTYPDEDTVMEIAAAWSIDPTTLDERPDIKGLGLLGVRK